MQKYKKSAKISGYQNTELLKKSTYKDLYYTLIYIDVSYSGSLFLINHTY